MRRTKEDAEVTRQLILDAALSVFSRQGFAQTRLEEIAQEANVTRGAIYHHFGGKAELYNALLEERFARANRIWQDALAEGGTPVEMLRRMAIRVLHHLEDDPDFRAVQEMVIFKTTAVPELSAGLEAKRTGTRAYIDYLAQLIEQGIDQGEFRAGLNPRDTALALLGLINGVSTSWLLDQELFSLRTRAESIVDTFLRGVLSQSGQPH